MVDVTLWILATMMGVMGLILILLAFRLARVNERLLVALVSKNGDVSGARALVAMDRPPQKPIPGVSSNGKTSPTSVGDGIVVTYGGEPTE